jgi:hypothetical protein
MNTHKILNFLEIGSHYLILAGLQFAMSIDQVGLKLIEIPLPLPPGWILALKVHKHQKQQKRERKTKMSKKTEAAVQEGHKTYRVKR